MISQILIKINIFLYTKKKRYHKIYETDYASRQFDMDNPLEQSIETSCIDRVAFQMIFVIQLQLSSSKATCLYRTANFNCPESKSMRLGSNLVYRKPIDRNPWL